MISEKIPCTLETQFHKGVRWALFGSIIYELLKTAHYILLSCLISPSEYGFIVSMLSSIYFVTKFADFGASTSILPFFNLLIKSKNNFKRLIFYYYLLPHVPLLFLTALVTTTVIYVNRLQTINLGVLLFIIICESLRAFLRLFLYTNLKFKRTIIADVTSFIIYLLIIWVPFICFSTPLSLKYILISHIFDSSLATTIFLFFTYQSYQKLPEGNVELPSNLKSRMFCTKIFNFFLRLSRECFTSNFLTPFFALKFGLKYAGLFYLGSVISHSIQSIFKISIGYTGNAILANLKNNSLVEKQHAFELLTQKLTSIFLPFFIFFLINYRQFLHYAKYSDLSSLVFLLTIVFLMIQVIDFIISLYEQFYVMEEASPQFFVYKILEFTLFFLIIRQQTQSPLTTLFEIISIKFLSFFLIALNAFYNWHIKPKFRANPQHVTLSLTLALIVFLFL